MRAHRFPAGITEVIKVGKFFMRAVGQLLDITLKFEQMHHLSSPWSRWQWCKAHHVPYLFHWHWDPPGELYRWILDTRVTSEPLIIVTNGKAEVQLKRSSLYPQVISARIAVTSRTYVPIDLEGLFEDSSFYVHKGLAVDYVVDRLEKLGPRGLALVRMRCFDSLEKAEPVIRGLERFLAEKNAVPRIGPETAV